MYIFRKPAFLVLSYSTNFWNLSIDDIYRASVQAAYCDFPKMDLSDDITICGLENHNLQLSDSICSEAEIKEERLETSAEKGLNYFQYYVSWNKVSFAFDC